MSDDEIIDLVRECDLDWHAGWAGDDEDNRYARLVRAAVEREREACAALCASFVRDEIATGKVDHNERPWTDHCAAAIRARAEKERG